MNWISNILRILPKETIINFILDWLADEAKKTENEIDDRAVQIVRTILESVLKK